MPVTQVKAAKLHGAISRVAIEIKTRIHSAYWSLLRRGYAIIEKKGK